MIKQVENNLIKLARGGDQEATNELIENYKGLVNSIARRYFIVGGETEDLIQEGMIGLFNAIQSYDETSEASFKTFANLLIKRKVQSAIKSANRQKNKMLNQYITVNNQGIIVMDNNLSVTDENDEKELGIYIESEYPDPENSVISKEMQDFIKMEIEKKLTILEKNILELFIAGKSYAQIAKELNLNTKAVDNNLFRIRKKLSHLKNK